MPIFDGMSLETKKLSLIAQLMQVREEITLDRIAQLLHQSETKSNVDSDRDLSQRLDNAAQQVEDGEVISHDQVRQKYERWL